jgi:hypothetical protein
MPLTHAERKRLIELARQAARKRILRSVDFSLSDYAHVQLLQSGGAIVDVQLELTQEQLADVAGQ